MQMQGRQPFVGFAGHASRNACLPASLLSTVAIVRPAHAPACWTQKEATNQRQCRGGVGSKRILELDRPRQGVRKNCEMDLSWRRIGVCRHVQASMLQTIVVGRSRRCRTAEATMELRTMAEQAANLIPKLRDMRLEGFPCLLLCVSCSC